MTSSEPTSPQPGSPTAWDLFRTPTSRETSGKTTQILATAVPVKVPHRQVLHWPSNGHDPEIALQAYVWPGPGEQSPTVLLIHGWEWQAGRWEAFIGPLRAAGWRVAAYDAPAHGRSEGTMSTLLDYAASIRSVAEAVGGVRALIGHSFGGMAALWLLSEGHGVARPLLGVERVVSLSAATDVEFLLRSSTRFPAADEDTRQRFREEFRQNIGALPTDFNAAVAGARLSQPALIAHDQRDLVVPYEHAQAYVAALPRAELLTTSGLGHRFILRDAAVVQRAVDFLAPAQQANSNGLLANA